MTSSDVPLDGIAIVGMAGRFPGAEDIGVFWEHLCAGVEAVRFFSDEELVAAGVAPGVVSDARYVKASPVLEGIELFDASFFGFSPREAEVLDPQHRLFLECAWEAVEHAGYDPGRFPGAIGVYAGCGMNTYLLYNLAFNRELLDSLNDFQVFISNEKDFLATRVSYLLDLKGPSVNVQTACSTSLVALYLACQSLLMYQCDMALAGGVSIRVPQIAGYVYQEDGIRSPDGHCRAFDAQARGTVFGSGAGVVVLKRYEDAVRDGDTIHAIVKGVAVNNDGALKIGYTAPGVDGQAQVIAEAIAMAGIEADAVSYVEAHGTGTALGDPIEVAALTQAFRMTTDAVGFCAIGSVKTNIGHLDTAAGVAGLVKVVEALKHRQIPASLHYESPNPKVDFAQTPFYVNAALRDWSGPAPLRAGVSSLGIGGTNAHVVVEEAPLPSLSGPSRPWQVLVISAKSAAALEVATTRLFAYVRGAPQVSFADVAFTLQVGRKVFGYRRVLVGRDARDCVRALEAGEDCTVFEELRERPVVLMVADSGAEYVAMGQEVYQAEPDFRGAVDVCAEVLRPLVGVDIRSSFAAARVSQGFVSPGVAAASHFVAAYALAQLWRVWGVQPAAMMGVGAGEFVVACLAGVLTLEDALALVVRRAEVLAQGGDVQVQRVALRQAIQKVARRAPQVPYVSGTTGGWVSAEQVRDGAYWEGVGGGEVEVGLRVLLQEPNRVFVEVGPGRAMVTALRRQAGGADAVGVYSLRAVHERVADGAVLLMALGQLWAAGVRIDWEGFSQHEVRRRVPLPTYPFERQRYWIAPPSAVVPDVPSPEVVPSVVPMARWFSVPVWKQSALVVPLDGVPPLPGARWLVFLDGFGVGEQVAVRLERQGATVVRVRAGGGFEQLGERLYCCDPGEPQGYGQLLEAIERAVGVPQAVVHAWSVGGGDGVVGGDGGAVDDVGFYSLLFLVQAYEQRQWQQPMGLWVVTDGLFRVTGAEVTMAEKATLLGPCRVIPQEYPGVLCRLIEVSLAEGRFGSPEHLADVVLREVLVQRGDAIVAYRGGRRWVQVFEPVALPVDGVDARRSPRLRDGGVYVITGGLGGLGCELVRSLARSVRARLVVVGRRAMPPRDDWGVLLAAGAVDEWVRRAMVVVEEAERAGAEVLICQADVSDVAAMAAVREAALARFGAVHGVVHAAGVLGGGLMQLRGREQVAQTFAPKVRGGRVVAEVFAQDELDFLVFFSSVNAVVGGFGQVDYAAANAFLDALACELSVTRAGQTVAINWGAWQEAGMAADMFAAMMRRSGGGGAQVGGSPLVRYCLSRAADRVIVYSEFSLADDWVLGDHRLLGYGLLPGTVYLELARAVFVQEHGPGPVVLSDVIFLAPLFVKEQQAARVYTVLERAGDGYDFVVVSEVQRGGVVGYQEHAKGQVGRSVLEDVAVYPIAQVIAACDGAPFDVRQPVDDDQALLVFGRHWQTLTAVYVGAGQGVVVLDLPDVFGGELAEYGVHPSLMDVATGAVRKLHEGLYLPLSYRRMVVRRPLAARIFSHIQHGGGGDAQGDVIVSDVVVVTEAGEECVRIEGFVMRKVHNPDVVRRGLLSGALMQGGLSSGSERYARLLAPSDLARVYVEGGMTSEEGVRVFNSILATDVQPQIVVSPRDIDEVIRQANSFTTSRVAQVLGGDGAEGARYPRPHLSSAYVAPRSPVEEQLARAWEAVLGVAPIGVDDNFFELGGHSLMATQLAARLRALYPVELPLQKLFETPTIGQLADDITAQLIEKLDLLSEEEALLLL